MLLKGKIDEKGFLLIVRAGEMRFQFCPYCIVSGELEGKTVQQPMSCGDWCPHFLERGLTEDKSVFVLRTCQNILNFEEFEDERKPETSPRESD